MLGWRPEGSAPAGPKVRPNATAKVRGLRVWGAGGTEPRERQGRVSACAGGPGPGQELSAQDQGALGSEISGAGKGRSPVRRHRQLILEGARRVFG